MTESEMFIKLRDTTRFVMNVYSIETGVTEVGIPDTYFSTLSGSQGWIELKQLSNYKKGIVKIPYRPGQRYWLTKHKDIGIKVYVLLYIKDNYILFNKFNEGFDNIVHLVQNSLWSGQNLLDSQFLIELLKVSN